jgi:hypothetical protein
MTPDDALTASTLAMLDAWSDCAYTHEEAFLTEFAQPGSDLLSVHWNSATMRIVYLLPEGQHLTTSFPVSNWLAFYAAHPRKPGDSA